MQDTIFAGLATTHQRRLPGGSSLKACSVARCDPVAVHPDKFRYRYCFSRTEGIIRPPTWFVGSKRCYLTVFRRVLERAR